MTAYESKTLAALPLPVRRRVEWHLDRAVPFAVALECSMIGVAFGAAKCRHGHAQGSLFDGQAQLFTGGR